jgi:hypothetical protein
MGKSGLLRLRDVRRAFRVVGECRDLGSDSEAWRRHALQGMGHLIGARVGIGVAVHWRRPDGPFRVVRALSTGFEPNEQIAFAEYHRHHSRSPMDDPIIARLRTLSGSLLTHTRPQLIDDARWYASRTFNEHHRAGGIDHFIGSLRERSPGGATDLMTLYRSVGERDFSPRDPRLMHLFHSELGRLIGPVLTPDDGSDHPRLSPRLRQTLDRLLAGDSEKQVARRLGLSSQPTE